MLLIKLQKVIFVSNQNIVPIKKSVVALAVCCIKARTSLEMDGTVNTHYLFTIMNTQKKDNFQFCFPGLLGIHRNPV